MHVALKTHEYAVSWNERKDKKENQLKAAK